jgi:hypothetical protein
VNGFRWVLLSVGAIGLALLFIQHWVHALGIVPYLVLLACPLMHLFHRHPGAHRPLASAPGSKEKTR